MKHHRLHIDIGLPILFAAILFLASAIGIGRLSELGVSVQPDRGSEEVATRQAPSGDSTTLASASPATVVLTATVRDFLDSHSDFEGSISGHTIGLVLDELDDEDKPVFAGPDGKAGISNRETFEQWFRDVPDVNQTTMISLTLAETAPGSLIYSFSDASFFPLDDRLSGNQGREHNYHFTLEMHTDFTYQGGEVFTFSGDDDVWVFIDGRLVIDLGGVHPKISDSIELDTLALSKDATYPLSIFFAERHTPSSNFEITTSIYTLESPKLYAISGSVTSETGEGIGNVEVYAHGPRSEYGITTDADGRYTISVITPGVYNVLARRVSGPELVPHARQVEVPPNAAEVNFAEEPDDGTEEPDDGAEEPKVASVFGKITAPGGTAVQQAVVNVGGYIATANDAGEYNITGIPPGLHSVAVTVEGYLPYKGQVEAVENVTTNYDVELTPRMSGTYQLPYPAGAAYTMTQGNNTGSHIGTWKYAYDFGLSEGAIVAAAADGIVKQIKDDSSVACNVKDDACFEQGNYVRIRHKGADGLLYDTLYYHLQQHSVPLKLNQSIKSGCEIGRAGNTGYYSEVAPLPQLDFTLHEAGRLNSIQVGFVDVDEPGGYPKEHRAYVSGNHCPEPEPPGNGGGTTPPDEPEPGDPDFLDTEPPNGTVSIHLTGTSMHSLRLYAVDYHSEVDAMRLAPTKEEIPSAPWIPFAETVEWPFYGVFAQFRDSAGNVSEIVSDAIDATAYAPIQAALEAPPSLCRGEPLSILNQTRPYSLQYNWHWDFDNAGFSNAAEPELDLLYNFSRLAPNDYTVTLTVTNLEHTESASADVRVLAVPSAEFSITRARNVITVVAEEQEALNWAWDFGDGTTANGPTATHAYASIEAVDQADVVVLRIEGANGCVGERRIPLTAAVSEPARADFAGTPKSGRVPVTVTFENLSSGDYTDSEWRLGDGNTVYAENAVHTYTEPGLYSVRLGLTGPGGTDTLMRAEYIEVFAPTTGGGNQNGNHGLYLPFVER